MSVFDWVDEPSVGDMTEDFSEVFADFMVGCLDEEFVWGEADEREVDEVVEAKGVTLGEGCEVLAEVGVAYIELFCESALV